MTNAKAKLRRDETGRCSRSTCVCEAEGLGPECVWLVPTDAELERRTGEPHIDGYPLHSGLPTRADALEAALKECVTTMRHARVFTRSREKMHPDGQALFDAALDAAARALLEKPQ